MNDNKNFIEKLEAERKVLKLEEQNLLENFYPHEDEMDEEHESEINRYLSSPEYRLHEVGKEINDIEEKIGSYRRIEFLEKNIVQLNKNSIKALKEDHLNRRDLAKVISKLISDQGIEDNLSVGILGEWGSGKSTFLKLIQSELKEHTNMIQFNASKYDDREQIWYSLLLAISEKYFMNEKILFKRFTYIRKSTKVRKERGLLLGSIVAPIFLVIFLTIFRNSFNDPDSLFDAIGISTGILSLFTGYLSFELVKKLISNMKEYFSNNKERFLTQLNYPNYKQYLGTRERVREDLIIFRDLIIKQIELKETEKNLIIFVDELDRCSDKTIINFFSSIEAFIDIPGVTFVFSINPEIIYPVVAESVPFKNLDDTEDTLSQQIKRGASFIEKYINLFVTLPISSDYRKFVEEILEGIIDSQSIQKLNKLINMIAYNQKTSPREMKKMIDLILIYKEDFLDLTFLEFSTLLIMKYYYIDFINIFTGIKPHSNVLIKEINESEFIIDEDSAVPKDVIFYMKELLAESNMNSINRNMRRIERILAFT